MVLFRLACGSADASSEWRRRFGPGESDREAGEEVNAVGEPILNGGPA